MKRLVIDGNSILNRAFYGVKSLTSRKGVPTGALHGFLQMYFREESEVRPDSVAVAFDLKAPTFRHKAHDYYKAKRRPMPEDLAAQLPLIKEILLAMGIPVLSAEGYEADDILGTISRRCDEAGEECFLMTGDRDCLQLVSDHTTVRLIRTHEVTEYTPERFQYEYGFEPVHMIDLKALMGDASDNIPGIRGVGEKTAIPLIQKFGTIEAMYEHLEDVPGTEKFRAKLQDGKADAEESKWLATIYREVPLDPECCQMQPRDDERLRRLLTELDMFRMLGRFGLTPLEGTPAKAASKPLEKPPVLTEKPWSLEDIGALPPPVGYTLREGTLLVCGEGQVWKTKDEGEILRFLSSPLPKATDDAKAHYAYALARGTALEGLVFDAAVCGYLLNPSAENYSAAALCEQLDAPHFPALEDVADAAALHALSARGETALEEQDMGRLWREVELPLTRVLASMEHVGVLVDTKGIEDFGERLREPIEALSKEIYALAGEEFNIGSTKQVSEILFEKLALPAGRKTKSGYSTDAEVLEPLADKHPIVPLLLEYRQYTKLRSTYVDGLLKCVAKDGRIHTNYRQTETRTGRISSTEPNLQNIPVRTSLGREMRKFFRAAPGCVLLDADYSQIELRLMAHLSGDDAMQEAFRNGEDIHTATAAKVFGMPEEFVTPEMRSASKAVNFGILYGMGPYSLSKEIHVSLPKAKRYIADYLGAYPKVSEFLERTVNDAKEKGYVCTMFGRRRYVPELRAKNKNQEASGRRIAMNTPVQGSAADLIKLAMVRVHDRLQKEVPSARLLLQVHDELIVEVPEKDADAAAAVLHEEMVGAAKLSVPLLADVNRGETWYDAKN